jgi:hypothetical protein
MREQKRWTGNTKYTGEGDEARCCLFDCERLLSLNLAVVIFCSRVKLTRRATQAMKAVRVGTRNVMTVASQTSR